MSMDDDFERERRNAEAFGRHKELQRVLSVIDAYLLVLRSRQGSEACTEAVEELRHRVSRP